MFYLIVLLAAISQAIQSVFMVRYYRTIDPLSVIAYRGLSLGISMLPVIYFAEAGAWSKLPDATSAILLAAILGALGNWCISSAFLSFPVGRTNAIAMSCTAIVASILGFIFFGEQLSNIEIIMVGLVLIGIFSLGFSEMAEGFQPTQSKTMGTIQCAAFGVFIGTAFNFLGSASRVSDPFIAAYLWEFSIGIFALVIAIARKPFGFPGLQAVSLKTFRGILIASSMTAAGTALYSLSLTKGSIAIASALITTMMVFTAIFSVFVYKEKLPLRNWLIICFICISVIGLTLSSG